MSASIGAAALAPPRPRRLAGALGEPLDVAHAQAPRDDAVGDRVGIGAARAARARGRPKSCPPASSARLCSGRPSSRSVLATWLRLLPTMRGDVGVRILVVGAELGVAVGLLERVEIGALDVLDDREFERLAIADVDDDDRDVVQPGALRRAPAPLAGDDLVGVGDARNGPHDHRLDDAALADRSGELVELVFAERLARVARVGPQEFDRRLARRAARRRAGSSPASPISAARPRPRRGR